MKYLSTEVPFKQFVLALTLCVKALIFPLLANAGDTAAVKLVSIGLASDSDYSYSASVQIGSRVETLHLNRYEPFNNLNIVNTNGDPLVQTSTAYRGIVKNIATSNVEVVIDGMFISGTISTNGNYLYIDSSEASGRKSSLNFSNSNDPLDLHHSALEKVNTNTREISSENEPGAPNQRLDDSVTHVARIGVLVDNLYQTSRGWNGVGKAIAVINSVDALYRRVFGLAIEIEVLVLEEYQGTILLYESITQRNLNRLREYRTASEHLPRDLAFVKLFTGMSMPPGEDGRVAFIGSVCDTDGNDIGLVGPSAITETLTAHEIGHILGATHDDDPDSDCRFTDRYIMQSFMNDDTEEEFSSCSIEQIKRTIEQSECLIPVSDYEFSDEIVMIVDDRPSRRPVYSGGGSTDVWIILFILLMLPARRTYLSSSVNENEYS